MRRVPDPIKALRGTLRKDRVNPRAPKPPVASPRPRRSLAATTRAEFRRLVRLLGPLRVLSEADVVALELGAEALAEYRQARAALEKHGQTYLTTTATGSTMVRTRPEQAIAADAWRRAAAMLDRFGANPASRPKVEAGEPTPAWARGASTALGRKFFSDPPSSEPDALDAFRRRRAARKSPPGEAAP